MGGRGKGEALPKGKHMDPTPRTGGGVRVEGGVKFLIHPFKKKKKKGKDTEGFWEGEEGESGRERRRKEVGDGPQLRGGRSVLGLFASLAAVFARALGCP